MGSFDGPQELEADQLKIIFEEVWLQLDLCEILQGRLRDLLFLLVGFPWLGVQNEEAVILKLGMCL